MDKTKNPHNGGHKSLTARHSTTLPITTARHIAWKSQSPPGIPRRPSGYRPADLFLPRLEKVRDRGPGSWVACCPAHDDRSPSLSVRETGDSTLLIKCFAGCDVHSIVAAVGLELSNLFPPRHNDDYGPRHKVRAPTFPWRDAIKTLRHYLLVVQIGTARLAAGDELSEHDLDSMGAAALEVSTLLEEVGA